MSARLLGWLAVATVAASALVYGSVDDGDPLSNADRVFRLSQEYACPQCNGQSVAESEVPVARAIRNEIRVLVDEGATDGQINDALVASYGEGISYRPRSSGIAGLVWILPVVAAAAAVAGLVLAFQRWKQQGTTTASAADTALVAQAQRDASAADGGGDSTVRGSP